MTAWRVALWVAVVLIVIGFLYLVRSILLPFIVVFIIATLLEPLVRKLRYKGMRRGIAVISVLAPFYLVLIGAGVFLTPRVIGEVSTLSESVNSLAGTISATGDQANFFVRWNPLVQKETSEGIEGQIDKILTQFRGPLDHLGLPSTREEIIHEYVEPHKAQIDSYIRGGFNSFFGILGSVFSQALSLVVIFVGTPMLLLDMEAYKRQFPRWIPPSIRPTFMAVMNDVGQVFSKYLRGVAMVVLLYMICASILLTILGAPFSILLGILFGVLYLVPILGNLMVYVTLFLTFGLTGVHSGYLFHFSSPWLYAIVATLSYSLMGLVFDQLLYPSLVGNAVGLSGIVSLFVIFCGAALFGIVGMIIAFPLAGSIKIVLDRLLKFATASQDQLHLPSVPARHRHSLGA